LLTHRTSTLMWSLVNTQIAAATRIASVTIPLASRSECATSARAAASAYGPHEPMPMSPSSGSMTSPLPEMINECSPSATARSASSRRRTRSVRQSLATSTAARARLPRCSSSRLSKRAKSVKASAAGPAEPVGARVEQVRREGVTEGVRAHPPHDTRRGGAPPHDRMDRSDRESAAPVVREERPAPLCALPEVGVEGAGGPAAEGDDPFLPPLAQHPHGLSRSVHVLAVQADQLGHAQPRRAQELQTRHVPLARGAADRLALDQHLRLVDRQERHELPPEARGADVTGHVPGKPPPPDEETEPAP